MNLPEILKAEKTKGDLFRLPREALEIIFGHSETCLSEFELFKAIEARLQEGEGNDNIEGDKEELKEIREEVNSKQSQCSTSESEFLKSLL